MIMVTFLMDVTEYLENLNERQALNCKNCDLMMANGIWREIRPREYFQRM